ncbi:hypothetical protein [Roseomonas indoligenes]|uniref:DUF4412 domain-containing protein n=1 Tax=Roseomonas indoligenes TaxID=2820811 RepID=A0A940N3A2_9PROT|nr:hypothetical protein [Pararoseomonas indoligenes]MBP0495975.1 hypothetical protein [Pararoseomonas indoligenes]
MPLLRLAAIAALVLPALPAMAQNAPPATLPTRDVAVTYRALGNGAPPEPFRMAWSVADGKQRVDPPGGMGWMLVDRKAGTAVMVMDAQRMLMPMPSQAVRALTQSVPEGVRFERRGTATIAGLGCTEWAASGPQGQGVACLTEDGVTLRATGQGPNGQQGGIEATEVRYGTQDPAHFQVPQGYQTMQGMPGMPGSPGGAPGAPPAR